MLKSACSTLAHIQRLNTNHKPACLNRTSRGVDLFIFFSSRWSATIVAHLLLRYLLRNVITTCDNEGKIKKTKQKQNLCYLNCAAPPMKKSQGLFQKQKRKKNSSEGLNRVALKQRMSIYCVIYLSVAGFTINSFLFFKKTILYMEKIVIIGSSDSHNYDSYTVELTKAASARRGVHADRWLALNRWPSHICKKTKPHSPPF